jgi:hypothetical protein
VDLTSIPADPQMSALASLGTFLNKINPFAQHKPLTKDTKPTLPSDSYS